MYGFSHDFRMKIENVKLSAFKFRNLWKCFAADLKSTLFVNHINYTLSAIKNLKFWFQSEQHDADVWKLLQIRKKQTGMYVCIVYTGNDMMNIILLLVLWNQSKFNMVAGFSYNCVVENCLKFCDNKRSVITSIQTLYIVLFIILLMYLWVRFVHRYSSNAV